MSNVQRFDNVKQIVAMVEPDFNALARIHGAVSYAREASFALEMLANNEYLASIAMGSPDSLKRAIINVAAIGLSLSPVHKLAYLVPRDKKICLDISYRGYIQLAVDVGAVKWVVAEVVCEKDNYTYQGIGREPIHTFNPFGDRGEVIGAYCLAKTHEGEFLLAQMSADEIVAIRDRSQSWIAHTTKGANSPWASDRNEMIKKTVIRRAAKSWPMTDTRSRDRFAQAIDVGTDSDPLALSAPPAPEVQTARTKSFEAISAHLKTLDRSEAQYLSHLAIVNSREIKTFEDLTDIEIGQAITMLEHLVQQKKAKEAKHENAG